MTGWAILMLIGFAGSALYSGLETGAYRLNRVRLAVLDHQGHSGARRLRRMIEHPTALLTTLLLGNNLMNQLGAASLTAMLELRGLSTLQILVFTTLIVTPLLFIFGETLPKDLFAAYADRLMYRLTWPLMISQQVFRWTGIAPLVGLFTGLLLRALGGRGTPRELHPRRRMEDLVKEGVGYGVLSDDQSVIAQRVLDLSARTVADEMVPWKQVITVRREASIDALWQLAAGSERSRFPVVDEQGKVVGVLGIDEVLSYEKSVCPPLEQLMEPAVSIRAGEPWRAALSRMQREHISLAIVVDAHDKPLGIVTVKDLVEPVTGELGNW
ncbi:MAG: DUF21 domain-containing protein [Phycisphaeraceae bacterium]|nr:DUF21 domain-containing protein [Phycisphaeraceae bacterium]